MTKSLKECFEMLRTARRLDRRFASSFFLDAFGYALFPDYDDGAGGVEMRGRMRMFRPSIEEDLAEVYEFQQFLALVANYRMDMGGE